MRRACIYTCFVLIAAACSQQKVSQSRSEKLYKKENNELKTQLCVYHISDSTSILLYDILNESLIYKKTDTSTYFYSNCRFHYKTSTEPGYRPICDSGTVAIADRQTAVDVKHITGSVHMKLRTGGHYFSEISIVDLNKKSQYVYHLQVDKSSVNTRQNFLMRNSKKEINFNTHFVPGETISIETQTNPGKTYVVDCFSHDFSIAKPPFSNDQPNHYSYQPDSSFSTGKVNGVITLHLPEKGFLHLKTDEATKEGVTCFVFEPSYPKISNTTQMVLATRYIMNKKEFDLCINADDKKTAIDKFWLDIGGSNERAKELLKRYYGRVQETNTMFTSYQEGWKTDRGMIYIVLGAPSSVLKRKNGEIWTYGDIGNPNALSFSFIKVLNPFSDNDYALERSEAFRIPWYQAVDFWRQGRIYLDN